MQGAAASSDDMRVGGSWPAFRVATVGESTFPKQGAMIVLLAQVGSFVPVARARIGASGNDVAEQVGPPGRGVEARRQLPIEPGEIVLLTSLAASLHGRRQ